MLGLGKCEEKKTLTEIELRKLWKGLLDAVIKILSTKCNNKWSGCNNNKLTNTGINMGFMTTVGKNGSLNYEVSDSGILTIQIDTSQDIGPSASGKTTMLASSGGNIKIDIGTKDEPREVLLGLNLYHY